MPILGKMTQRPMSQLRWLNKISKIIWRILPVLLSLILIIPLQNTGILAQIESQLYNLLTVWRGELLWDQRIAIIEIDEPSLSKLGQFPWNRDRYTQLLNKINPLENSIIGFDILWTEPTPQDDQLAAAIAKYPNVVLAMAWDRQGKPLLPLEKFSQVSLGVGHILKREDSDGIVRHMEMQIQGIPTLALALLQAYELTVQAIPALPDLNQQLLINWTNSTQKIPHFSFSEVLEGKVPTSQLRNRILLVGVTASGLDSLTTPFERNPPVNGVHLHAMVLQNLLQNQSFKLVPFHNYGSVALLISLLMSLVLPRKNLWSGSISTVSIVGMWLAIAFGAFRANYLLNSAMPIALFMFTGLAIALQERWHIYKSLQQADAKLDHANTHDAVTNLYNQRVIEERLADLLNTNAALHLDHSNGFRNSLSITILWINLPRFKTIKDTFGQHISNLLLIEIANRLQSFWTNIFSDRDTQNMLIARFSGADFVILWEKASHRQEVVNLVKKLQSHLGEPYTIQKQHIDIATNIGIKFYDRDDLEGGASAETMLQDADTAMTNSRKLGSDRYMIFQNSMREQALSRLQLEQDLYQAVADMERYRHQYANTDFLDYIESIPSEFIIYYQPILALHNMRIVGLEALIRWQHPTMGFISPSKFIPIAEESDLIIPIGDWVMEKACWQLQQWHQRFPKFRHLTVSVNLSPKQLAKEDVLQKCMAVLERTNLSPQYLKIELTESTAMENTQTAMHVLQRMRGEGLQIYIDDFGTGYSSLSYLAQFPFDGLKIDRSFVTNIYAGSKGNDIIQAIVSLANSVDVHIVAEGIENMHQLNYLQNLLDHQGDGQGFFLFRPLTVESLESILEIGSY
ncbi:MAG: EAL domain-containing protein [Pseudanabaenaceae cyanobacterium bins.39]|nr:EAL domain-containing protein [Pseudanabaenaceae cyanobacterium bins.39]